MKFKVKKDFYIYDFMKYIESLELETCPEFKTDISVYFNTVSGPLCKFISGWIYDVGTLFEMLKERANFRKYIIKGGFIEEIKPEVFYKTGDRFKIWDNIYLLCAVDGHNLKFINIKSGNRLNDITANPPDWDHIDGKTISKLANCNFYEKVNE